MRVQLAQQVQELVGTSELVIITERVDDVALLIGHMVKMGFVEVLDRHIPRHWQQRALSWGWTAVIWLASILTEGDHRKVSVEAYIQGMHHTLSHLSGQVITPLDCSDDRLGHLLKHLSQWFRQKSGGDSAVRSEFVIAGMIFHPSRVKSELLHKYIEESFVEVTLLPACHREDGWLLALLHAQILSAHQIERRQRGIEMKI